MLLFYNCSSLGIRSVGDLLLCWCFLVLRLFCVCLFVCVCLFDGMFARRGYWCVFVIGVVMDVLIVLVGGFVVVLFVRCVSVVIGGVVIVRVIVLVFLKCLWFVFVLLHYPRTCLGIRRLGGLCL